MCYNTCSGSCGGTDGTANCFPVGCSPQGCYSYCAEFCRAICDSVGCYGSCNGLATNNLFLYIIINNNLIILKEIIIKNIMDKIYHSMNY